MTKTRPFVILMTDRTKFGAPIRAVPRPYLRQQTAMTMGHAQRFESEREARKWLRKAKKDPRYLYTIASLWPGAATAIAAVAPGWLPLRFAPTHQPSSL